MTEKQQAAEAVHKRLNRLENAIGSQVLSDYSVDSDHGRLILSDLIDEAGKQDFQPEQIRQRIIKGLSS